MLLEDFLETRREQKQLKERLEDHRRNDQSDGVELRPVLPPLWAMLMRERWKGGGRDGGGSAGGAGG
jgi:hypothetical protein